MVVSFKAILYSEEIMSKIYEAKIDVWPVNKYRVSDKTLGTKRTFEKLTLILGYGNVQSEKIIEGINRLEKAIRTAKG